MMNFVVPRDFGSGLDFLAKAKSLRPKPAYCKAKATKFGLKAKAKD